MLKHIKDGKYTVCGLQAQHAPVADAVVSDPRLGTCPACVETHKRFNAEISQTASVTLTAGDWAVVIAALSFTDVPGRSVVDRDLAAENILRQLRLAKTRPDPASCTCGMFRNGRADHKATLRCPYHGL
jgi:hypothetical protein